MRLLFALLLATALAAVMAVQIMNLSYVLTVGGADWLGVFGLDLRMVIGIVWAVGIELGVLVSVLAGHRQRAAVLAAGGFAVNMLVAQVWGQPPHLAAAKGVVYALSAYLLWYFSELFGQAYAHNAADFLKGKAGVGNGSDVVNGVVNEHPPVVNSPAAAVNGNRLAVNNGVNGVNKNPQTVNDTVNSVSGRPETVNNGQKTVNGPSTAAPENVNSPVGSVLTPLTGKTPPFRDSFVQCPHCGWRGLGAAWYQHMKRSHPDIGADSARCKRLF